ncbi:Mn-dependent transcriptional regulator, DtxR family [Sporobacter termitidis DSM 10068]|uniref:Mn-dependent transcriptional regulator, DtxR family n=1 Tax=Sporobacter termitidis DSM 10068 TaxID=1123282 RepID=A0A1M5WLH0_9FIRM|nr:MarR family transcriptional regulator [Sporobacter termitidis]SHH88262.1 Mn-dependent transcriptional regulator, DtxR family [Sporobacter termitidis DSM 10068]
MLTPRQARYLLAIHEMRGRERSMSRLAETLGVSKPSVTNMINAFKQKGLVDKGGSLVLTAQGKALANEILSRQALLSAYFSRELGLAAEDIRNDVLALMFEMSSKFTESLIRKIETDAAKAELRRFSGSVYLTNFEGILPDGIYELPFRLLKENNGQLSMGDKGFIHPARLVVTGGFGVISLRAVPVTHKALRGDLLKGRLARLFYWNGADFAEAAEQDGVYSLPVMGMHWRHDAEKNVDFGVVRIKVHASVGIFNMPDSVADLAIYLE